MTRPATRPTTSPRRRARRRALAVLVLALGAAATGCTRASPDDRSVVQPGVTLPPEFVALGVSTVDGKPRIEGSYRHGERTVRFVTARGPRVAFYEVAAGASPFEIDACFLSESGRPLVSVAGGHEVTIPECRGPGDGAHADEQDEAASDDGALRAAFAAMDALAELPFRPDLEPEKKALVGSREFRNGPAGLQGPGPVVVPGGS